MKKLLSFLVALVMLMSASCALAARGDAVPIRQEVDGYDISTAAVLGDTVYASNWNVLLRYKLGDEKATEMDITQEDISGIRALCASDGKLYALNESWSGEGNDVSGKLTELIIEGDTVKAGTSIDLDWKDMIIQEGDSTYSRNYESPIIMDGQLYLIAMDYNWEKMSLISFSLTDGSCKTIAEDIKCNGIVPYKDGQLLALSYEIDMWSGSCFIGALDLKTGTTTKAFEIDKSPREVCGLAYDAASDMTYYVTGGQIHGVKGLDISTDQAINDMPLQNNSSLPRPGYLIDGGFYMFYNYNAMLVRNLNPDERPTRTLTIRGYLEPDSTYYAFTAAHPDVAVVIDTEYSYGDDVTKAMMNRDDKVDIYIMMTSQPDFRAMTGRGYVQELTDEIIREQVSHMYPAIKKVLTSDGKLVAVPQSQGGGSIFSINKRTLEKLKLTEDDLPRTWVEMIDFLEQWDERFGSDFPEVTPMDPSRMPNLRLNLLSDIFTNRISAMEAGGEQKFDSPSLRETLKRLDEADFGSIETPESADGSYSWSSDGLLFSSWGQIGFSDWQNTDEVTWPLSFSKEEAPLVPLMLQVYVINPFSKNADIAEEYLKTSLERMKPGLRITLCPDENGPVRETGYKMQMRDMEKQIELYNVELEKAAPEDKQIYEGYIKDYEGYIEDYDKRSWSASAEGIARYRELAQGLVVPTYTGFGEQNAEETMSILQRYADKQIPMDQFISSIDQKMRMMLMEGY